MNESMNYELALRLKNAGFPQRYPRPSLAETPAQYEKFISQMDPYEPSLETLIKACGMPEEELSIIGSNDGWRAVTQWWDVDSQMNVVVQSGYGDTPSEAVASLWLKLNEKA